jgi:hypothetical protein
MISLLIVFLISFDIINGIHFNGGTITWSPVDPYDNSSSVIITITQTYSWSYPTITCANNVPTSTSGRSGANTNLTCVVDCSTDGGYSTHPIDILTDCISSSSTLGMMTSQRSVNVSLLAGAHFMVAYQGSAWRALDSPPVNGLYWSVLCSIDLRIREDGIINTPPVSSVVSPQYVFVNQTTQIQIPVSDVNRGDDVRCRWSVYQQGYRRRRRSYNENENINRYKSIINEKENIYIRKKRDSCTTGPCNGKCGKDCYCYCPICLSTNCAPGNNGKCNSPPSCPVTPSTTVITTPTTPTTPTSSAPTTTETPGTGFI